MKYTNQAVGGYAQLVEAQSPEPQQSSDNLDEPKIPDSSKVEDDTARVSIPKAPDDSRTTDFSDFQTPDRSEADLSGEEAGNNTLYKFTAKNSSFVSLESANEQNEHEFRDQSATILRHDSTEGVQGSKSEELATGHHRRSLQNLEESIETTDRGNSSTGSSSTRADLGMKPEAKQSITQSMLALDQGRKCNKRFEVQWRNLTFSYKRNRLWSLFGSHKISHNQVLTNVSGSLESNQLVAIIGPSGSGKTSLLRFLVGDENPKTLAKSSAHFSGTVDIVGLDEPKVAFIGQHDCLMPGLTVRETLLYASRFQNGNPNFNHERHIEPILNDLGLHECADREVTKISGGQMKRVTIAQELLYPTNLLILDEVTSGLDASTSYAIVKLLKQLVSDQDYPMSIVMSIHQPSARLFSVFDKVFVMSEGSTIYEGSSDVNTINAHLAKFDLECPKFHNIADFLIEIACESSPSVREARAKLIEYHNETSDSRNQLMLPAEEYQDTCLNCPAEDPDEPDLVNESSHLKIDMLKRYNLFEAIEKARSQRPKLFWQQFFLHKSRSYLRIGRSHILTYLQLATYIILGLQLASYFGPKIGLSSGCPELPASFLSFMLFSASTSGDAPNEYENYGGEMRRIQENMNMFLIAIMTVTFAALELTVITFPLEAKTVRREWRNGWYRVSSYFLGRTLADLPFQVIFVTIFCMIIYMATGQIGPTSWRFASFTSTIVLNGLFAQSIGFMFGSFFMDNLPAAVFTAPLSIFPSLLFSGFFARASQVPDFYKPINHLSHFTYVFNAVIVTLYGYQRCECDQETLNIYHASLKNQTSSLRDVFRGLFGSAECEPSGLSSGPLTTPSANENSIEDLTTPLSVVSGTQSGLGILPAPASTSLGSLASFGSLEDRLVDSAFAQMLNQSEPSTPQRNVMDQMLDRLSTRITALVNANANYGHPVPSNCNDFKSHLMTEYDVRNQDLLVAFCVLTMFVVCSRLLCYLILNFTIASRAN